MQRWLFALFLCGACDTARAPRFVVLDRGAGVLAWLDQDLLVQAHAPAGAAFLLAADAEAVWVGESELCASPPSRLRRLGADREGARALGFAGLAALAPDGGGGVFVLDRPSPARSRLWQVEPWMTRRFLGEFARATALAVGGRELLLASEGGELLRLRRDGAVLGRSLLQGSVRALAGGLPDGDWFVLAQGEGPYLMRLSAELAPRWTVGLAAECAGFALDHAAGRTWLVEGAELVCLGPGGNRELALGLPSRGGPWRVFAAHGARAWLAGTGALLAIDSAGARAWIARTQGGFDELAAAVSPRGATALPPGASSRPAPPPAPARAPG